VPRGPEAAAVRRARPSARVVELPAGAAAADALPAFDADETAVVVGLCGALWRLKAGDVAVYGRVADAERAFALDAGLVDALTAALPGAVVANACTAKRVVTTTDARTALAQRFNADVVDMEGTPLAAALTARGVRFAMVRVVSDDASRDLPPLDDAIAPDGSLRPLRIALALARSPRAAYAFIRNVRAALSKLTQTTRTLDGLSR
jgi:hypothetical protein